MEFEGSTTRMVRRLVAIAAAAVVTAGLVAPATAGPPTEQLKAQIDRVLDVLKDESRQGPEHRAERQQVIRAVMNAGIDFTETSRGALGPVWERLTPAQRQRFVAAFAAFLERGYLGRVELYDGQRLVYDDERIDGDAAVVQTRIEFKDGDELAVAFRMHRSGEAWRVYDVSPDGISLVENYRAQFTSVLRRSSFEELLKRIETQGAGRR